jgi:uroporphyrin-III C-methyltransferase/precorrin-2 dehydrogenase/sirohydrochlorin ferrochelatase
MWDILARKPFLSVKPSRFLVANPRLRAERRPCEDRGMNPEMDGADREFSPPEGGLDAIRPLANLPVFFKLTGRRVALAGDGEGAAWKAELLASAGARVDAFAPEPSEALLAVAGRRDGVRVIRRRWAAADLRGAALAVLETRDDAEAGAFRAAAGNAGAPVNVVDRPEFCDFSFAAIVNRSPLVVSISTDGAAPVFAQAIRARLEALLPASFAAWAEAARDWRKRVAALAPDFRRRRDFWERFAERALASGDRGPSPADFESLAAAPARDGAAAKGEIVLVGAGPGDPDLVTLKAVRALQSADVVLFDHLVDPRVVELARREARRVDVGKRGGAPSPPQSEITAMLIALAGEGKKVVRLKGGDPGVFGRANEEIRAARAAGIEVTIVPGVTAALAAAALMGISLSDKALARRIQFVSARDAEGGLPEGLEWRALADPDATTAVYMGAGALPALVARLLAEGLDPATPAAMLENVGLSGARRIVAPIASLPGRVAAAPPSGPALLLYGRALEAAS